MDKPGNNFTHAPWSVDGCGIIDAEGFVVATVAISYHDDENESKRSANAQLIAAAPDLLEALKDIIYQYYNADGNLKLYDGPLDVDMAESAIRKASGR